MGDHGQMRRKLRNLYARGLILENSQASHGACIVLNHSFLSGEIRWRVGKLPFTFRAPLFRSPIYIIIIY